LPDDVPEPIDQELTDSTDEPRGAGGPLAVETPRRDPALSYYIHVGAVKTDDDEK
jgi:hypothetical protein